MDKKKLLIIVGSIIAVITAIIIVLLIGNKKPITYDISFETNGGSLVESQVVNEGEQVKKPVDPTKDGYMFVEWTYQGRTYDFSLEVTSDLTLTARWVELEEDVETFIVKFETDGGTTISNQVVEKGDKVAKPIDPVKDGYTFKGWTLNDEIYDFETVVEEDIELKAKWEKVKETNNNTTNNGSSNNNSGSNNNNTTKPTTPTTPTTPTVKKYTVTFNSNGGSAVSSQTVTEGGKASKPSNPSRSGFTFVGWTLNGNVYDFNSAVNGNITLVAKWNENAKAKYTVTFDSNGGSAVSSQTITEGSKASQPSNPTRTGYNFGGWLLNGSAYDFNSAVNGNITLVAKWNQKSYTVKATPVDQYSPDRILTVYEDGTQISVSAIKYNGVTLCSGSNMVVNMYEISGISSVTVVLTNGSSVSASVQQ